jgi:hypothetical protein
VAARRLSPSQVVARDRREALRVADGQSRRSLKRMMAAAERELAERLKRAEGLRGRDSSSFTQAQAKVLLRQVREVQRTIRSGMRTQILDQGSRTAEQAARSTVEYLRRAEKKFAGIAEPLSIKTATIIDRATAGTESSILHRIERDPAHPSRPGVLDRYDSNVIRKFEEQVQLRLMTRQTWAEARDGLVKSSPFLQQAPMSWAQRILRTESANAHNRAGWEAMRQSNELLGDMLRILCATFDSRTGADSYAVHGQIRRVDEPFESWFGLYMHPPNRPNDREVVVPHRMSWPIPASLEPLSDGEVEARWMEEGRKGSPPPRPQMETVDRDLIGRRSEPEQDAQE